MSRTRTTTQNGDYSGAARRHAVSLIAAVAAFSTLAACSDASSDTATENGAGTKVESPITAEILGLTGSITCGATDTSDDPCLAAGTVPEGKDVKLGFFCLSNDSYSAGQSAEIQSLAKANGASVTDVPNAFNGAEQVRQIQDALTADKFDAYLICPVNPVALTSFYKQMVSKNIPYGTIDFINGDANGGANSLTDGQTIQVIKPPTIAGEAIGANTVAACADLDPCNVAPIRGIEGFPYDTGLFTGFDKIVSEHSNINVYTALYGEYSVAGGRTAAQDILSAHPDVNVIAGFNDQMGLGAVPVVEAAGKADSVLIIGNAGSQAAVDAVKAGKLYGTSAQIPLSEATFATIQLLAKARGVDVPALGIDSTQILGDVPPLLNQSNLSDWASFVPQWSGA